ncbi:MULTISPECIES: helix-turn-helix domain-containing protein [Serratia]|uniref:helix-turn-helix domain-containing protein n=1 Tax=Serratia TaxID=613 RepID=UPI0004669B7B|nr:MULTISPECIES: helix-turn-helix domain-containing protein [Serratia]UAN62216.1 helix-turn-helix domain-containing protein [Serratia sp. JSRIV006]
MLSKNLAMVFQKLLVNELHIIQGKIPTHYIRDGKKSAILLLSGSVLLKRMTDDIIISEIEAPFVFGIHEAIFNKTNLYIKPLSESVLKTVDFDLFYQNVPPEVMTNICAKLIDIYQIRDESVICSSVYDCIKKCLEDINSLEGNEKYNISIFGYIKERNKISRSSISKVIRELERGGYIKTKRGKLLSLNKLPKKF